MFSFICCIAGAIVFGYGITGIMTWWERRPVIEEKQPPFYITKTYQEIINEYDN